MTHPFEIAHDLEVEATREEAWDAIATGPGMDSWFMGRSEVEPRQGGTSRWSIGGYTETATVTAWDPPSRFASTGTEGPDGTFHRFEYRIEDRGAGRSTVRYVHSGMLGEDWEAEYDAMQEGDPMYLAKLVEYLAHFRGRYAVGVDAHGPNVGDRERAMAGFRRALGLSDAVAEGDAVRFPIGGAIVDGVVDYVSPSFIGVRSDDAMYRFIRGFDGTVMVGHHLFADGADAAEAQRAWTAWLADTFADGAGDGASAR